MATGRFRTEAVEGDRDQRLPGSTAARPDRDDRARRVAPGRVAMGVANYDRIAVRPAATV